MQGHECSKEMSKSKTGLNRTLVKADENRHGMGRVGEGRAYGVPKTELRFEVRMENRKVMDSKGLRDQHGSRGGRDWSSSAVLHRV